MVRVAVVDSGIRQSSHIHRVVEAVSCFSDTDPAAPALTKGAHDQLGHGTKCTEIISLLAPEADILAVRIFGAHLTTSRAVLFNALEWVRDQHVDVLNMSLAIESAAWRAGLYELCNALYRDGVIIVAAVLDAAHSGYPAAFDNVIAVRSDNRAKYVHAMRRVDDAADVAVTPVWRGTRLAKLHDGVTTANSWATAAASGAIARLMKARRGVRDLLDVIEVDGGALIRPSKLLQSASLTNPSA